MFTRLGSMAHAPEVSQTTKVHLIYARRHKARMVADGNLMVEPLENVFSAVALPQCRWTMIFLPEPNKLELWLTAMLLVLKHTSWRKL
jgi:hypothetical protein